MQYNNLYNLEKLVNLNENFSWRSWEKTDSRRLNDFCIC